MQVTQVSVGPSDNETMLREFKERVRQRVRVGVSLFEKITKSLIRTKFLFRRQSYRNSRDIIWLSGDQPASL
jgi:hypothetical protein